MKKTAKTAKTKAKYSLCRYLANHSEEMGLRVYIEFAVNYWGYRHIYDVWLAQQEYILRNPDHFPIKTSYVCYEDLIRPETVKTSYNQVMDWLFPTGNWEQYVAHNPTTNMDKQYHGNHSTSHDPVVQQRLRDIVLKLDAEIFDHFLSKADALFQCGGSNATDSPSSTTTTTTATITNLKDFLQKTEAGKIWTNVMRSPCATATGD